MINHEKIKYKIVELEKPKNSRRGRIKINGREPELHERKTLECLSDYGFDVETIIPSNVPGSRNPDILMMGTFWEMKAPRTTDRETIATRFRKAIKQSSGKVIFDLRNIDGKMRMEEVKEIIMGLFLSTRGMRRIMVIEITDNGEEKILDISKRK